jgi:hypothetical protein
MKKKIVIFPTFFFGFFFNLGTNLFCAVAASDITHFPLSVTLGPVMAMNSLFLMIIYWNITIPIGYIEEEKEPEDEPS